jgi:hypothetical protein
MKTELVQARKLVDEEHITVEQMGERLHKALEKLAEKK